MTYVTGVVEVKSQIDKIKLSWDNLIVSWFEG